MSQAISRRPFLLGGLLALAVAGMAFQLTTSPAALLKLPLFDFAAFWSAGRLNHDGVDPYDPERLGELQHAAEPDHEGVLVMWPAPWALALLKPFAFLDVGLAHLLWQLLILGALVAAADWTWRLYGGAPEQRWVAWLVTFTFAPSIFVLVAGQFGPLLLLGFVGFLYCIRTGRDGLAGASLVLAAIKPQLGLLFWLALLLWAVERRKWRLITGGLLGVAALLAVPLWDNPHLLSQYWYAITQRTQTHSHLSPLPAHALRLLFGYQHTWLQFVPLIPGLVWLAWYWRRHRQNWSWNERLPALLFASLLAAPYGAWPFDLVLLLPAVLQATVKLGRVPRPVIATAAGWWGVVNVLALVQVLAGVEYFWFVWMTPLLLVGWFLAVQAGVRATVCVPACRPQITAPSARI
jgi:hypothetical protein